MTFKQMKTIWVLFKLGFKVRMMGPKHRKFYLELTRFNIDVSEDLMSEEKKAFHKFIDKIEEGLDK